ncbi:SusD/RagB family nutrient-binding outer membrane lipoprotein [Segatella bryantii]|jgi:hypothetical protein|uniref:SusD/RagB family nutrient-binding outer membrane lipoprotein n=1 Tax=Segatella bryantii TaxID=77095 RepID=A0ABX4EKH8_SEGBR|nr:SusD/RagB family nutrient-binding outer membrane lipoprotein [Segatella bryantii]MDR4931935.1 SusD/RagB family nutrient-binding outer membrane lipoprotein [Segatella bryantii]OYP55636.1 SusD/RagB family nutrient-binding outer membrane lipoprotein [Segatella bryantii]UKK80855.1 SusD/RagB family nutrient-binding outer membrane lipoprotein [Segatella bryantii]
MKKIYMLGFALALFGLVSCSENQLDSINKDEAHSGVDIVNAKFQITEAETSTVYSLLCGNYAWYVSSYTEQLFGTGNNQLKNVELRHASELAGSSVFNNEWNSTYTSLNNIVNIRKKATDGINAGHSDVMGMAEVLEAINWGVLTDLHGDIPYSEAFGEVAAPKIDSQKDVYDHIFSLLDDAIVNLAKGGSEVGSQDILFGGKTAKWLGLAHAVKARYLLHTYGVNKTDDLLKQVLAEANAAVEAGFDGCSLNVFNGVTADNSWSAYWWSRYYIGSSTTVGNLMKDRNDPRYALYNFNMFENDVIATPGDDKMAQETKYVNAPAWLENGAASLHIFSKSELYFILAEVKARLGQDATADFETAVTASMEDYSDACSPVTETTISDSEIAEYLVAEKVLFTANPLKEIFVQKYLAQTRDEQLETYNDMRRCSYVDGSYAVTMTNSKNTQGGFNRWPLRLPYGDSDVVSNPNVAAAFGTGNDAGNYVFTEPVWWAGGNR